MVLNFAVPVLFLEFYPFTTVPLFPGSPQHYCRYEIVTWAGVREPDHRFDLQRSDWGDKRGWPTGLKNVRGYDHFGVVPSEQELTEHLSKELTRYPWIRGITVTQHVFGQIENGVGEVETRTLDVSNLAHGER